MANVLVAGLAWSWHAFRYVVEVPAKAVSASVGKREALIMTGQNLDRRGFLKLGVGALAGAAMPALWPEMSRAAAPAQAGPLREYTLTARPARISLGQGPEFTALTYEGQAPGPEIKVREGETLRVTLHNQLDQPTSIHWHGMPLPNPMDGVPGLTQEAVPPGGSFVYEFPAGPAGAYLYHSHVDYQLDQGLYGPLIVESARPQGGWDQELTLVLEDWARVDGGGPNAPRRRPAMGMGGMMGGGMMGGGMMGGRRGPGGRGGFGGGSLLEPYYDAYAINGRVGPAVTPLSVRKGDKVRLRLINAGSATIFFLRLAGHRLTILACDANPVQPLNVDVLRLGMGERYDVEFVADNPGRWLLQAWDSSLGESGLMLPVLYQGVNPGPATPPEFRGKPAGARYDLLRALRPNKGAGQEVTRRYRQDLGWMMHSNWWPINGQLWPNAERLLVREGERTRLLYRNATGMPHPMHLHGHFFSVVLPGVAPELWPRKDTAVVEANQQLEIEFLADNPGRWFHHCHNLYHMMAGMANTVEYQA